MLRPYCPDEQISPERSANCELGRQIKTPPSLIEAVERVQAGEEERLAVAEFLDEFHTALPKAQAMIDAEPLIVRRQPFDAFIGAVGEHLARRWGLQIPAWVEDERRFLHAPFFPDNLQLMKPILLRDSPIAFRRRLIFTEAEPLRRGRFPKPQPL